MSRMLIGTGLLCEAIVNTMTAYSYGYLAHPGWLLGLAVLGMIPTASWAGQRVYKSLTEGETRFTLSDSGSG